MSAIAISTATIAAPAISTATLVTLSTLLTVT